MGIQGVRFCHGGSPTSHTIIQRPHHTCPPSPSSSQHLRPSPSDYTLLVLAGPPTWSPWMRHGIAKQTRPHDGKSSWRPLKHDAAGWRHPIASKLSSDSAHRFHTDSGAARSSTRSCASGDQLAAGQLVTSVMLASSISLASPRRRRAPLFHPYQENRLQADRLGRAGWLSPKETEAPEELIYELLTEKGMSAVFMRQHDLAKRRSETWNEMAIFSKLKPPKKKSTFVEAQIARSLASPRLTPPRTYRSPRP